MSNLIFTETVDGITIKWNFYSAIICILILCIWFLICLFQYSDRFTPILLIVSLAGIKVCSPDGKVSIKEAHVVTFAKEKDTSRLYMAVVIEKPICLRHFPRRELHSLKLCAKSLPLLVVDTTTPYCTLYRVTFRHQSENEVT